MYMSKSYSSQEMRQSSLFLRNDYKATGFYNIPIVAKCDIDVSNICLIPSDKINKKETINNICKTIHFYVDDYKINKFYKNPHIHLPTLAQYRHLITPDYSMYNDMPIALQIESTFRNRWCGAFWQDYGLSVIPSIGWSTDESFNFCFDGIELGSVVSVCTVGRNIDKKLFLRGYDEMIERINPKQVLCVGKPFPEMGNEVFFAPHRETIKGGQTNG